jgi:hypothetical protein
MKRTLVELGAQLVALIVLLVVIGFGAGFLGSVTGVSASAMAPDFHIQLADRLGYVCPKGETVSIDHSKTVTGVDARGHAYAGQSNDLYCTSSAAGTRHELTAEEYVAAKAASIGVAIGFYTLIFFVVLFVPLEAVAAFLIHRIVGALMKGAPAQNNLAPQ